MINLCRGQSKMINLWNTYCSMINSIPSVQYNPSRLRVLINKIIYEYVCLHVPNVDCICGAIVSGRAAD